jgi:putative N6-adenine-specific DNA methylase
MLAACGWWQPAAQCVSGAPLYDPCCGSGTIVIEAAQLALGIAPGGQRRFGFERLLPFRAEDWVAIKQEARNPVMASDTVRIFGSDVAHRMVDFAQRNAQRAGVAAALQLRGGDALQRLPPASEPGVLLLNPPYGERIAVAGVAGDSPRRERAGRERFVSPGANTTDASADTPDTGDAFFARLATHWKTHYAGWTAWLLTPDRHLPARLRLTATRRVPLWNGPIECRLLRFDITGRHDPKSGV